MTPVSMPAAAVLPGDTTPKPKDAADAARQFEALLLNQLLRNAHEEADDSMGDKDASGDTLWDVAAQQFSQMLSQGGGVGLAKLIQQKLPNSTSSIDVTAAPVMAGDAS